MNDLHDLITTDDQGASRMMALLRHPDVAQITANRHDRIFYADAQGSKGLDPVFTPTTYLNWINQLMSLTDVGYPDIAKVSGAVVEGSFDPAKTDVHGSIHVCTREITRGDPIVTIRKQPRDTITLDKMFEQGMMDERMRLFLEQAVRGRLNIALSGGSGAGKTTLARAMSWYIDPNNRVITIEDIDELHLADRLPNVVSLTRHRLRNEQGVVLRETTLTDLVEEALRMRADRIWVGETRGKEAYALTKAMNTGHDGSVTTVHADTSQAAWKQLVGYVMEAGVPQEVARDRVATAFHLSVQISRGRMGRRMITEVTELETATEGSELRRIPLFKYNAEQDRFEMVGAPSKHLITALERYGANGYDVFT